jgi:hypothetical protein
LARDPVTSRPSGEAALATGLLGLGLLLLGFGSHQTSPPEPSAFADAAETSARVVHPATARIERRSASREDRGVEDLITGPVLPGADPVGVAIPRLGISSRLVPLGVDSDGAMEVPDEPADAGWYRLGPPPGTLGPAVIAGHVTWNQVPAVFFHLSALRPGDVVEVMRTDRRVAVFEVTRVRLFDKAEFPTQAVFGPADHAGLRLITCGGEYESSAHRYLGNVVVFARLASARGT